MNPLNMKDPRLASVLAAQTRPLLFVTISGAHLYGFASADSDVDLRGVHCLSLAETIGLDVRDETIESSDIVDGLESDLVTHDVRKFIQMLLKRNGYVLEQLLSPLVLHTTPEHAEMKSLAPGCVTRHHAFHYLGFAETQWGLVCKETPPRVKPLLYTYRVLLTGIHLMQTGDVVAHLPSLNEKMQLNHVNDLLAQKRAGTEQQTVGAVDFEFHRREVQRLTELLKSEHDRSTLPELPTSRAALNDLLIRIRMSNR